MEQMQQMKNGLRGRPMRSADGGYLFHPLFCGESSRQRQSQPANQTPVGLPFSHGWEKVALPRKAG